MMPFKNKVLEKMIRRKRWDIHETSRQLGIVGVVFSPSQLRKILLGDRLQPRGDVLAGLCRVFGVGVEEFYELA